MTQELKQQFTERIIELQQRVEAIHQDFAQGRDADWSEQAGERENDEVLNALESEAKVEIQQLSLALNKIKQGNYGICEGCGEAIAPERLNVQPAAIKCVQCAE
ncbi:TraR/DksA C4-type zinc finger protein [Thalassotalea sp. G2M2-11]|uniref:TraR/DksA family transcriptional regulator n=1 Tax=Thalassotalea sp. G2M2-11 TaxID=2787627 RepID=UPI0019D0C1D0|nr:TraR/DksA C4-type zinc finger protein [Thalassotalea sp. G2M2-11]